MGEPLASARLVKAARAAIDAIAVQHATRMPLAMNYGYTTMQKLKHAIDAFEAEGQANEVSGSTNNHGDNT
jgi:hypothetical protein